MKMFKHMTDGGKDSVVHGYWLIECKALFSVVLLVFENGSREAYHNHAFNCFSWVLKGHLTEDHLNGKSNNITPSIIPFGTYRDTFHRVTSKKRTWVFSVRGPWNKTWKEYLPDSKEIVTLTSGRKIIHTTGRNNE